MYINQNKYQKNPYFMKLALAQARLNLGDTNENPSVGCVLVKNNNVIGVGSTSKRGRPHAEINAINFTKTKINGSTLYVTLEPCSHYGKTPPCTRSIISNKIKKVFFSINDPDLRSNNKCSKILKNKKINVYKGIYNKEANFFYRSYIKSKKSFLPFVTLKIALSKDFFTINKKSKWITNKFSRGRVHLMRANHDCIITSSKTIINDDPKMTCRIQGLGSKSPSRIILDNRLKVSLNAKIIKDAHKYKTIIFYNKTNKKKIRLLKRNKVKLFKIPLDRNENLDLLQSLIKAKKLGFYRIFVEAGMKLTNDFLYNNLIDDLKIFISATKLEINGVNNIKKYLKSFLKGKIKDEERVNLFGEKLITYKIK